MGHDPPMDGSSEPYIVKFFSRSAPDAALRSRLAPPGTVGRVLVAIAFFGIVLGPVAVAIYALASIAGAELPAPR